MRILKALRSLTLETRVLFLVVGYISSIIATGILFTLAMWWSDPDRSHHKDSHPHQTLTDSIGEYSQ